MPPTHLRSIEKPLKIARQVLLRSLSLDAEPEARDVMLVANVFVIKRNVKTAEFIMKLLHILGKLRTELAFFYNSKSKIVILTIFTFSFSGCQEEMGIEADIDHRVITIDPEKTVHTEFSDVFSEFDFIRLQTPEEKIIGEVEKIQILDNRIYILDTFKSKGLFVFDIMGSYLFDISNFGFGPGEFTEPSDFFIDPKNQQIIIYDLPSAKLSFFNIEDGKHKRDEKLPFFTENFFVLNDQYIFFRNNIVYGNEYRFVITDKNFNIKHQYQYIPEETRKIHFQLPQIFSTSSEHSSSEVFITVPFQNDIFRIKSSDMALKAFTKINFEDKNINHNLFSSFRDNRELLSELNKNYAFNITNYYSNENIEFFTFKFREEHNFYFNFKKPQQTILTSSRKFSLENTIGPYPNWPTTFYKNSFVWAQYSDQLMEYFKFYEELFNKNEWLEFKKEKKELVDFMNSLPVHENIYLIFTKIKEKPSYIDNQKTPNLH